MMNFLAPVFKTIPLIIGFLIVSFTIISWGYIIFSLIYQKNQQRLYSKNYAQCSIMRVEITL